MTASLRYTRRRWLAAWASLGVAGCARAPDLVPGESGRVARIVDGDTLTLDTGLRVRLAEIEAPAVSYGDAFAAEAARLLEVAALGRTAKLYYGGLTRDRYQRALAHVIVNDETGADVWLNGYMIRQGGARVRTYPDNARRVRRLYPLEEEARGARRGLWALPDYRVRATGDLDGAPAFAILQGPLLGASPVAGDGFAHLTPAGVRLGIGDRLGEADSLLTLLAGRPLRVRGRIQTGEDDPAIRITHWGQVETPGAPSDRGDKT